MGVISLVLDTDPFSPKVDDKEVHLVHKKDDEEAFDFGLFYTNQPKEGLFGFVDLFSDRLCFTHGGTRISQQHHPRFRVCVFEVDDSICSIRLWHGRW